MAMLTVTSVIKIRNIGTHGTSYTINEHTNPKINKAYSTHRI
jgi:hypothetical protein